ncbi:YdcF family protein [Hymenobacter jeollabukensis]|uniref:YdcF family protein n=1 Tax=Hymenobacter jeollabukensis TaxID=2025313 RepID=A0A5R8WK41_9BACT|nr:YdcF family protein [Hymenobacter jeollabukensis]TLM89092.1 YdcF family protein [Hymenobacter jeollabukensis]
MKLLFRVALAALLAGAAWHCVWTARRGLHDTARPADALLILGNTVNPDGQPSDRLRARLDKGLALYRAGLAPKIVVSGGLGREGHYEGLAMGRYLVAQGVPRPAVIIDDLGKTTRASAQNFAVIARQRHFRSVIAVSQFYHLPRTAYLLHRAGNFRVYTAHADYFELRDAYSLLREFPAYYWARLSNEQ